MADDIFARYSTLPTEASRRSQNRFATAHETHSSRSPPSRTLHPSPLRQISSQNSRPSDLKQGSYIVYPSDISLNAEEDCESGQVTTQPVSFVLSPSTQSRRLQEPTDMASLSQDLVLKTQPSDEMQRSYEKGNYHPLPPKPASRNQVIRGGGQPSEGRELYSTKTDMSRNSQNFAETVLRYSQGGEDVIKEESRDGGSIDEIQHPTDILDLQLLSAASLASSNASARRQLRFSSVKQDDTTPRVAMPEVAPFKIEMRAKQAMDRFHYDEEGLVSVRGAGEENQAPPSGKSGDMGASGYFKASAEGRFPLQEQSDSGNDKLRAAERKCARLEAQVQNLAKANETTILQLRPLLRKNEELEKQNEELSLLVEKQDSVYKSMRAELQRNQGQQVALERIELVSKKLALERDRRERVEQELQKTKRDKDELVQEIVNTASSTKAVVYKMEQEFGEYKERMSKELIAKDHLVQDLRKLLDARVEVEGWGGGRRDSLNSGQTTARNSRRTSGELKRKSESKARRTDREKALADENAALREQLARYRDEVGRLRGKLHKVSRSRERLERKRQETERSRSNVENYVEQAIMANEKLAERLGHKNAKIMNLKRKLRAISTESGGAGTGGGHSSRNSSRGGQRKNETRSRNSSQTGRVLEAVGESLKKHQAEARRLTREGSAPQLLSAFPLASQEDHRRQRRLQSRDISQSPRSISIERKDRRLRSSRGGYLEVGGTTTTRLSTQLPTTYTYAHQELEESGSKAERMVVRNTNHLGLGYMSRKYESEMLQHDPSVIGTQCSEEGGTGEVARVETELRWLQDEYGKLMRYNKSLHESHRAKERTRRELNSLASAMQVKEQELKMIKLTCPPPPGSLRTARCFRSA